MANWDLIFIWTLANSDLVFMRSELASDEGPNWLRSKLSNRGARWLSGRVSDSGARGPGFETYRRRVVSLSKTLYSPKVLINYPGSDGIRIPKKHRAILDPSRRDWKIVDWDIKPQHNQPNCPRSELTIAEVRIDQGPNRPRSELSDIHWALSRENLSLGCLTM